MAQIRFSIHYSTSLGCQKKIDYVSECDHRILIPEISQKEKSILIIQAFVITYPKGPDLRQLHCTLLYDILNLAKNSNK